MVTWNDITNTENILCSVTGTSRLGKSAVALQYYRYMVKHAIDQTAIYGE